MNSVASRLLSRSHCDWLVSYSCFSFDIGFTDALLSDRIRAWQLTMLAVEPSRGFFEGLPRTCNRHLENAVEFRSQDANKTRPELGRFTVTRTDCKWCVCVIVSHSGLCPPRAYDSCKPDFTHVPSLICYLRSGLRHWPGRP